MAYWHTVSLLQNLSRLFKNINGKPQLISEVKEEQKYTSIMGDAASTANVIFWNSGLVTLAMLKLVFI